MRAAAGRDSGVTWTRSQATELMRTFGGNLYHKGTERAGGGLSKNQGRVTPHWRDLFSIVISGASATCASGWPTIQDLPEILRTGPSGGQPRATSAAIPRPVTSSRSVTLHKSFPAAPASPENETHASQSAIRPRGGHAAQPASALAI